MRRPFPEFILGALLTVAIVAVSELFLSSTNLRWLTNEASGFFTFLLVVVGILQAGLFWLQFGYLGEGLNVAKDTARTAAETAAAARLQIKLAHRPFVAPLDGMRVTGSLKLGPRSISLPIMISWSNVGTFPARGLNVFPRLIVGPHPTTAEEIAAHLTDDYRYETKDFRRKLMAGDLIMPTAVLKDYPIDLTADYILKETCPLSLWVLVAIAYWGQERDDENIPIAYLGTFAYKFEFDHIPSDEDMEIDGRLTPIFGLSAGTT